MTIDFDWTHDENESPFTPSPQGEPPAPRTRWSRWFALVIITLLLAGLAWVGLMWLSARVDPRLREAVRAYLQLEQDAMRSGDGERFFSLQDDDPAWRSAQLLPVNQIFNAADRSLVSLERHGQDVWVTLASPDPAAPAAGPVIRMAFYRWAGGALRRIATDPAFWGETLTVEQPWGTLVISTRDGNLANAIGASIEADIADLCTPACGSIPPVIVTIAPDYGTTAAPGHIRVPSPRLLGIDGEGAPSASFRNLLRARLADVLTPATIRFGVPAQQLASYQDVAREFGSKYPGITVEIEALPSPETLTWTDIDELDSALLVPDVDWITAGRVLDLTDFAATDPDFRANDWTSLALDGARWRDRLWMLPLYQKASLLLIDANAYEAAGLTDASPTEWPALGQNLITVINAPGNEHLRWGFVDLSEDSLFAYALDSQCLTAGAVSCRQRLGEQAIAAALAWYRRWVEEGIAPDVTGLDAQARINFALNHQSNPRTVASWVDPPNYYEHHVQIAPLIIHPLPGLEGREVTPVDVRGSFIRAESERPRAVWAWLMYLSRTRPVDEARALPARPSVTETIDYWGQKPPALQSPLRAAFSNGRAIRLDERHLFPRDDLARLLAGEASAEELAADWLEIGWFGENEEVAR